MFKSSCSFTTDRSMGPTSLGCCGSGAEDEDISVSSGRKLGRFRRNLGLRARARVCLAANPTRESSAKRSEQYSLVATSVKSPSAMAKACSISITA